MEWQWQKLSKEDRTTIKYALWMMERDANNLSPQQLRDAREMAGLSLGQAARVMGIERESLESFENQGPQERPGQKLAIAMNDAYGINWKEPHAD